MSGCNLALSLSGQGKHAEAERIYRGVLGAERRVLGEKYPDTLITSCNLALSEAEQVQCVPAEKMLEFALQASRRVLGSAHPDTVETKQHLETVRPDMRAKQPTKRGGNATARHTAQHKERVPGVALSPTAQAEA